MSLMTTAAFPKALRPGVRKWYGDEYEQHPKFHLQMFQEVQSNQAQEEEVQQVGLGLTQVKPQGQPIVLDAMSQGYIHKTTHVAYALGIVITHEEIKDNLYMRLGEQRSKALAMSNRQTMEINAANKYNRAFNGSYTSNPGDGLSLCSKVHPLAGPNGGTLSNQPAADSDLSVLALEQACIDIMSYVNDRGFKIPILTSQLIVPPALSIKAYTILNSVLKSGTSDNDTNALRAMGMFPQGILVNPYLTNAKAWFIRTNARDGMIFYNREDEDFDVDNEFLSKNFRASVYTRYSFNYMDFRQIHGCPGT